MINTAKKYARRLISRLPPGLRVRVRNKFPVELQISLTKGIEHKLGKSEGPLVSVVVPAYNVAEYLPDFLTSITAQSYSNLEIIVVNDGSPDESAKIARRRAKIDPRISVIDRENGGLGAARNTGLAEANGKYIMFADSDDKLPKNSIDTMVSSLEDTESDFVVGSIMRMRENRKWMPIWVKSVHERDRLRIRVEDHPEIIHNVFAWSKLWRLEFFKDVVQGFPVGIVHEDLEPSLKAYFEARAFDVITDPVYLWRSRDDRTSLSQQKASMRNLRDRLLATLRCADRVTSQSNEAIRAAWCRKVFTVDILQFIEEVPRTGPEYFEVLSQGLRQLMERIDDTDLHAVPIYPRLAALYAARGDQDGLIDVISGRYQHGTGYRLRADSGDTYAIPSYAAKLPQPPDESFFRIFPESLELKTHLLSIVWLDESRVQLTGTAYVLSAYPDSEAEPIIVQLEQIQTGTRIPVTYEQYWASDANERSDTEWRDCRESGFKAVINTSDLPLAGIENINHAWRIRISTKVGEHRVTNLIQTRSENAAAGVLGFSSFIDGRRAVLLFDDYHGLVVHRSKPKSVALEQHLQARRVRLVVQSKTGAKIVRLRVANKQSLQRTILKRSRDSDSDRSVFEFNLPELPQADRNPGRKTWDLEAQFDDDTTGKIAAAGSIHDYLQHGPRPNPVAWQVSDKGYLTIAEYPFQFTCDHLSLEDGTRKLTATGTLYSANAELSPTILLRNDGNRLPAESVDWDSVSMRYSAQFSLENTRRDEEVVGLPTGRYYLDWLIPEDQRNGISDAQRAVLVDSASHILPWRNSTDFNSLRATRSHVGRHLRIYIGPPIVPNDRGIRARNQSITFAIKENDRDGMLNAAVFESYHGRNVSDSVLAISRALQRKHPEIKQYWSVTSDFISVPADTEKIIHGTPEWMNRAHRAKYLINNSNFPTYFRKQPGQRYLQTWHGSPMKRIGEDMPPGSLSLSYRLTMRREARYWDILLSQSPHSTKILPAAFGFQGRVLELGYPRNDILRNTDIDPLKQEIRARVGVPEAANVVLYAPTFRDNERSKGGFTFSEALDFRTLMAQIPQNTIVLVRAHSNIKNLKLNIRDSRIIDVSKYDEISELFLISDALVTDYSSMMFDFVVTGKPIIFHVPDIDDYEESVRGFYLDYRQECPGPLSETTEYTAEMVNRAIHSPSLFYDQKYELFTATYAPYDDGHVTDRTVAHLVNEGWFK